MFFPSQQPKVVYQACFIQVFEKHQISSFTTSLLVLKKQVCFKSFTFKVGKGKQPWFISYAYKLREQAKIDFRFICLGFILNKFKFIEKMWVKLKLKICIIKIKKLYGKTSN